MALGLPVDHSANGGAGTSATKVSFTPTADSILFCFVNVRRDAGAAADLPTTPTDSAGGTWTFIASDVVGTGPSQRGALFYRLIGSSPPAMTITSTCSTASYMTVMICAITGAAVDFTNVATGTSAVGDPAATLGSAPAATSTTMAWYGSHNTNSVTIPSGYTLINTGTSASTIRHTSCYEETTPGASAAFTSASTYATTILVEIKPAVYAGTGAGTIDPLTGAGVGVHGVVGTAAGVVAQLVGAAAGVHGVVGTAAGTIAPLVGAAVGAEAFVGTGAGIISQLNGEAVGVHGVVGTGAGLVASLAGAGVGVYDEGGGLGPALRSRPFIASMGQMMGR